MKNHDIDSIVEINCPLCDCREGRIISRYIGKTGRFLSAENIVTCTQCGLEFVHPLPGKDELDNYYSQGAYYHDSQPDTGQFFDFSSHLARSKIKLIKKYFNDDCFQKIIDIGAGNAAFGCTVKRLYPESIYHAVEPDRAVTSRYGIYVNNVFEWLDDIEDCDYTLAVVSQVLEHVIDPLAFLQSISSVMAPGGGIIIDVPNRDYLFKPDLEPHVIFWNKDSLTKAVNNSGFTIKFYNTVGMRCYNARGFFGTYTKLDLCRNPYRWLDKINNIIKAAGVPFKFGTMGRFKTDAYGGSRIWLRCLAEK